MSTGKEAPIKPWQSLTAGLLAGGIEGFITYPAEMIKTSCQFSAKAGQAVAPLSLVATTFRERGVRGFYSGCTALVIGNSAKAGVRFLSYDSIKNILKNKETGRLSMSGSVLAGMAAGACEATFAVTPSETIKTRLIDDARRAVPRFTGTANGVSVILKEEGLAGMYRGLAPTVVKQSANSAVRFTSYNTLVTMMQTFTGSTGKLPGTQTFLCGAGAGIITVYTTMPADVVKTRMQGLEASRYRNSLDCLRRIVAEEGVSALWGGSTARLSRLMFSGAIVFWAYEEIAAMCRKMDAEQ